MEIWQKIKNNQTLVHLIIVNALGVFAGSLLAPVEVVYLSTLTGYKALVGATFALGPIFIFIFSLLIGRLSRYVRRRKIVIVGLTLGILYPFVYASAINIFQYMFGRAAWAFAGVASGIIVSAFFQDMIREKKRIAEISGFQKSFNALAGALGALFSGYLADTYYLTTPFYWVSLIYLVALLFFIFKVYSKVNPLPAFPSDYKMSFMATIKDFWQNPFLFLRIFLEGITQSHWAMEPIIFPILIYNLTTKYLYTGLVFGLMGAVAVVVLPWAGSYIDKHSSVKGLKIAFSFYAVAFLILYLTDRIWLFVLGAILLSLGKAFNGPAFAKIETKRISSERRIEYLSYFKAYDTLMAALTCLIVGALLDFVSPKKILLLFFIFTLSGGVLGFWLYSRKQKKFQSI